MTRVRAVRFATGARVVIGAVAAAACAAGVVAAIHVPWPEITRSPAQVEVAPLPGEPVLVCTGDLRAIGRDSSDPLSMRSAGALALVTGGSDGDPSETPIAAPDLIGGGDVPRLSAAVVERSAPVIAAAESITVSSTDLAGLAGLPCGESRLESWLVGGSVDTGTKDLVVLTNAAAVTSTVTLSVHGETRSNRTVIIPSRTQVALPLASIAAGNPAPVVEVVAEGAPVRAVLQSSFVRTLDPAGIDLQEAVASPQRNVLLPGVQVFDGEGDDTDLTLLRLLSPDAAATASVTVRAPGSTAASQEFTVPLTADVPADVSLQGLPAGAYTVEVSADAPIVAAARQQDGFGRGSDFAWMTPAAEIADEVLFAVPRGPAARLHIANPGDVDATVTIETADGETVEEVVVPAGDSAEVGVRVGAVFRLSTSAPVHAVTMSGRGALATWPVAPGAGAESTITVYP